MTTPNTYLTVGDLKQFLQDIPDATEIAYVDFRGSWNPHRETFPSGLIAIVDGTSRFED